jgi:hypothetical protein
VVCAPDARRLASASLDGTIKIWDLETGQDVLTLHGHPEVFALAFSPDGRRLASGGNDNTIRIWDATPLSQEILEHREALGLVKFICREAGTEEQLDARIRADQTISEAVRRRALTLAGEYWLNLIRHKADLFVADLIEKATPKEEILTKIQTEFPRSQAARQQAVTTAETYEEDPDAMNWHSRRRISEPNRNAAAYRLALRQSERACQLVPNKGPYVTTLGIAQYRLASYADALRTLEQADKLNSAEKRSSIPANLAFLAMTRHQLGQKQEAKNTFDRLREVMNKPEWANDTEAQGFFREAAIVFDARTSESRK